MNNIITLINNECKLIEPKCVGDIIKGGKYYCLKYKFQKEEEIKFKCGYIKNEKCVYPKGKIQDNVFVN